MYHSFLKGSAVLTRSWSHSNAGQCFQNHGSGPLLWSTPMECSRNLLSGVQKIVEFVFIYFHGLKMIREIKLDYSYPVYHVVSWFTERTTLPIQGDFYHREEWPLSSSLSFRALWFARAPPKQITVRCANHRIFPTCCARMGRGHGQLIPYRSSVVIWRRNTWSSCQAEDT